MSEQNEEPVPLGYVRMSNPIVAYHACTRCGVPVVGVKEHDAFHKYVDGIARTARAADATAGMFRPIG